GPGRRREGHGPGGGNADGERDQRRSDGDDDGVEEGLEVVLLALNQRVALERARGDETEPRRRLALGLEAGDDGVKDREEEDQRHGPGENGHHGLALHGYGAGHQISPSLHRMARRGLMDPSSGLRPPSPTRGEGHEADAFELEESAVSALSPLVGEG